MDKLENALKEILDCNLCNGKGAQYWAFGEDDYNVEECDCNPYGLILDENGNVVYDNGMLNEPELLMSGEAK